MTTGDYNGDGTVNAADYTVWRNTFGHAVSHGSGADGIPDGTIDDADYNFWRQTSAVWWAVARSRGGPRAGNAYSDNAGRLRSDFLREPGPTESRQIKMKNSASLQLREKLPMSTMNFSLLFWCAVVCIVFLSGVASWTSAEPIVWTGPTISFSKPSGDNHTLPVNQDRLTANVALTRGNTQGMINILAESSYASLSPADTLWATALNNPGDTITATNWAALDFTTWSAAYANSVGPNILNYDAVVHLVTDDVYLDLRFTSYQGGGSGGAFSYQRSTPAPEPASVSLVILTLIALNPRRLAR